MVAKDIKQVWAYSTISQLGFMAMGLAAAALGGSTLFAGYYHLTTHAAFKALLFSAPASLSTTSAPTTFSS